MAVYRVGITVYCALAALWLHVAESAAVVAMDDGSLRLLALTTGQVDGYSTSIVQPQPGWWVGVWVRERAWSGLGG